ncbi:hypothetical protein LBW62_11750 [Ralstonia solanacearum]|uniref:hypothetical protein n=1 Tax=Ralstonia solanacearum TaxID=305 RepID=UPI001E5B269F|nr:hypothetical protein [Ralstonia solanacearum]MDB0541970.1 hypothetical protein [Ralstonia solanacearum]MDB0550490.1 hypothetical protein [Ralstonia solanacearum]MDB0556872.1 hypothetical protein [Ralstonia solanacearum]
MKSQKFAGSNPGHSRRTKLTTLSASAQLTKSEIERLRQQKKQLAGSARKVFTVLVSQKNSLPSIARSQHTLGARFGDSTVGSESDTAMASP